VCIAKRRRHPKTKPLYWVRVLSLVRRHPRTWPSPSLGRLPTSARNDTSTSKIVGVWEAEHPRLPATAAEPVGDGGIEPRQRRLTSEGDDYFLVRGELIYTRPESWRGVIKDRQKPRADGSRGFQPFKMQLKGENSPGALRSLRFP